MSTSSGRSACMANVMQVRYKPFLHMMRQWRHLHLLKRAGSGYNTAGVSSTKSGELTLLCPACPQPGINLSPDWTKECEKKP